MAVADALHSILAGQEAVRKATTWVEWEKDPEIEGRTKYRIHGPREGVQQAVNRLVDKVGEEGGFANFVGPYRRGDEYLAVGEVVQ